MNEYQKQGHADREAYLASLAEQHGLTIDEVRLAASMLGPSEDFDGLVTTLEDMASGMDG